MKCESSEVNKPKEEFSTLDCLPHDYWYFNIVHHEGEDLGTSHDLV